jgi:hypothetical protein
VISDVDTTVAIQEFVRHKVDATLETIDSVLAKSHPFQESEVALTALRAHVQSLRERVRNANVSLPVAKNNCRLVVDQLSEALSLVGFLERATEVTGPVEFHGPFARIVRRLLGEDYKLVLSSTWVFSPYTRTYPSDMPKGLEKFVYVSFCMSESDNAFLTPLAGHEVGHNIWSILRLGNEFNALIGAKIVSQIQNVFKNEWETVYGNGSTQGVDDLVGQTTWSQAAYWAKKQIEETFCDFIGLYLFGPSYIYAFANFVAPGTAEGEPSYPQAQHRFAQLVNGANVEQWDVNQLFSPFLFDHSIRPHIFDSNPNRELLLKIADATRAELCDEIRIRAKGIIEEQGLLFRNENLVNVIKSFEEGVPSTSATNLASIVNGGWSVLIDRYYLKSGAASIWGQPKSEAPKIINELLLKSFEIFEIEQRLKEAQCLTPQKSLI